MISTILIFFRVHFRVHFGRSLAKFIVQVSKLYFTCAIPETIEFKGKTPDPL